jgi:hypothetical protein
MARHGTAPEKFDDDTSEPLPGTLGVGIGDDLNVQNITSEVANDSPIAQRAC